MGEHRRKADGRRVFSTEFKRTTVQRILTGEKTLAELSRELDISPGVITPPLSCSSPAPPPWRTCARISPLPTSSCRPTRSTNSTGSALADVGCDSMSVNCPL